MEHVGPYPANLHATNFLPGNWVATWFIDILHRKVYKLYTGKVLLQNVLLQNVQVQNDQASKRPSSKTSRPQDDLGLNTSKPQKVQPTKRPSYKTSKPQNVQATKHPKSQNVPGPQNVQPKNVQATNHPNSLICGAYAVVFKSRISNFAVSMQ
jgi:hypothetical protein